MTYISNVSVYVYSNNLIFLLLCIDNAQFNQICANNKIEDQMMLKPNNT